MVSITQRCYAIAKCILYQDEPITINELAERFNVSERTIRYDLDKIEEWFDEQGVSLIIKSKVGIFVDKSAPGCSILKNKLSKPVELEQVYSPRERQVLIRGLLLENSNIYTISDLANKVNVSKSTVTKDLIEVEEWLSKCGIELIKKPNFGISIKYDEISYREAIINHIYEVYGKDEFLQLLNQTNVTLNKRNRLSSIIQSSNTFEVYDSLDADRLQLCIEKIENELNIIFTDSALVGLVFHLVLAIKRLRLGKKIIMPSNQLKKLKVLPEYNVSSKALSSIGEICEITFPEAEIGYFTIHILGASVKKKYMQDSLDDEGIFKHAENLIKITKEFVREIESRLGVDLVDDNEFIDGLLVHLKPAISRMKFNIYEKNQILKDIKEQYTNVFNIVNKSIVIFEEYFDCIFDDDEIGYITMHVIAAINRCRKSITGRYIKAAIVCSSGIGTAKLLSSKIKNEFRQIDVLCELSFLEFQDFDNESVDIVFSTIPLNPKNYENVIFVNTILAKEDKEKINDFIDLFSNKDFNRERYMQDIMFIIGRNCMIQDEDKLKKELKQFLYNDNIIKNSSKSGYLSLKDLITKEMVKIDVNSENWIDAITSGGMILLNKGLINYQYINDMIENNINLNSHVVIMPGVALPHALASGNVIKTCMSLITLKEPVIFGHQQNDPVKIIICLGSVDKNSHVKALYDLIKILEDDELLLKVMNASEEEEIINIIKEVSK